MFSTAVVLSLEPPTFAAKIELVSNTFAMVDRSVILGSHVEGRCLATTTGSLSNVVLLHSSFFHTKVMIFSTKRYLATTTGSLPT